MIATADRALSRQGTVKKPERQVAARWTSQLAEKGWTPVSDYFLANHHRLAITHGEAMVVVQLLAFKWDHAAPYPSLATIAKRMGITVPSVRTLVRKLEKKGFVRRQATNGSTNRFHLDGLFDALEDLMDSDSTATVE